MPKAESVHSALPTNSGDCPSSIEHEYQISDLSRSNCVLATAFHDQQTGAGCPTDVLALQSVGGI